MTQRRNETGTGGRPVRGRAARTVERREEILRAAMDVIAERGYDATSLAAVAERAGLTQAGLLHHFPNKEQLLVAVLEARDRWDLGAAGGSPESWTLALLDQLVEYNASRPRLVQTFAVLSGGSVADESPARTFFEDRYARVRSELAAAVRNEFAEHGGRLPGGLTPEQIAPLLAAVLDGLQVQWLLDPEAVDMPAAFRDFLTLLRAGGEDGTEDAAAPE
ncbi:TetR/AcrR family transcriptional regulator [Streptomyces sp. 8N114]|uniref:TetR/AcrR family transcriptional regulator n=1 Tax=Streptomyces sp. 8N114 TaxID=3457419 RepID=UPI003FD1FCD5